MTKLARKIAPNLTAEFARTIQDLDLTVVCYRDASQANNWLPRDLVGKDGKTLIIFRKADNEYDFNGYAPWHDGMFGGRYASIEGALSWVQRAMDIRSGRADNFIGF